MFITLVCKLVTFVYVEVKNNKLESGLSYFGVLLWHPCKLILSNRAKYCRQALKVGLLMKFMTLGFCIVLWMSSSVTYSSLSSRFCLSCAAWLMFVLFAPASFFICLFLTSGGKKPKWRGSKISLPSVFLMKVLSAMLSFCGMIVLPGSEVLTRCNFCVELPVLPCVF